MLLPVDSDPPPPQRIAEIRRDTCRAYGSWLPQRVVVPAFGAYASWLPAEGEEGAREGGEGGRESGFNWLQQAGPTVCAAVFSSPASRAGPLQAPVAGCELVARYTG